ncbi:MAG: purine-binding chemotaxis protein CheW [Gammaproteobacteria bacterium]|nr:purine-binding chemotaxis protein CheW [Gammaproteobacteria bacterium]
MEETIREIDSLADSSSEEQYLTFELAGEIYAIDILRVQEIKGWDKVTSVPNAPHYMQGVINLRGLIVPIVDLRKRFELDVVPYTETTVVIVMKVYSDIQDRTMGIIVDAVSDVHNIKNEQIKSAPIMHGAISNEFIQGLATVNDKMLIIINIDALLNSGALALEKAS